MKYIIALVAVAALVYAFYRRGKIAQTPKKVFTISPDNSETIEGELKMDDIVNYFRLSNLDAKKQTPFIAKWSDPLRDIVAGELKEGYEAIFAGVYNAATDDIKVLQKVFFAKSLDQAIQDAFGDETLIVLS